MKHIKAHTQLIAAIPPEKRVAKVRSSIIGVVSIGMGVGFQAWLDFPQWLNIGLIGFGFFSLSGELVRGFFGFLPAAIRDVKSAIRNGGG